MANMNKSVSIAMPFEDEAFRVVDMVDPAIIVHMKLEKTRPKGRSS
ncbi:hypothetical protein TGAMA5MH_03303 [Trichoderma gamsii]|uniref:Uncharacterized protein n=1 Tax=Trichoderma gamsii TaxID=398673 RepID=A0A2K0TH79_9HYPO|nr:hypothetical protein TGAMA5MH_03303 [Trichoderma gamsii]